MKCTECGEALAETELGTAHAGCCLHEQAEPGDRRNDPWYCRTCGEFVAPEQDEDGRVYFEALYL